MRALGISFLTLVILIPAAIIGLYLWRKRANISAAIQPAKSAMGPAPTQKGLVSSAGPTLNPNIGAKATSDTMVDLSEPSDGLPSPRDIYNAASVASGERTVSVQIGGQSYLIPASHVAGTPEYQASLGGPLPTSKYTDVPQDAAFNASVKAANLGPTTTQMLIENPGLAQYYGIPASNNVSASS